MKGDLRGLLINAAKQIEDPQKGDARYYAESLREVAGHIQQVRDGTATIEEFAECYRMECETDRGGQRVIITLKGICALTEARGE